MGAIENAQGITPTNGAPGDDILWTHVNVGEAVPGVVTPLTAAFWHNSHTRVPRAMYAEMGVSPKSQMNDPFTPENTPVQFVLGRMAANVDFLRAMADRLPGTSGAALEEQMLGSIRPEAKVTDDKSRYAFVAWGFVKLMLGMPKRTHALHARTMQRWRKLCEDMPMADYATALKAFEREITKGSDDILVTHGLTALLSPVVWEPLAAMVRKVGQEDEVLALSAGLGAVEEAEMMDALWALANGGQQEEAPDLTAFLNRYGFMGPDSGELEAKPWRQDARSLNAAMQAFKGNGNRPLDRQKKAAQKAQEVYEEVAARMNPLQRLGLKLATWLCRTYLPLREVGKACMVAHSDMGRLAAMRLGTLLADEGRIEAAADVVYLLPAELRAPHDYDLKALVKERKAHRKLYQQLNVPDAYTAKDIPGFWAALEKGESAVEAATEFSGLGVSRGTVEGVARVIEGPDDFADFKAGEILVCKTTDPGWAPVFTVAAALVVDIGGMLSHSAIIARELGVPAVVNTRNGTRWVKTGQRLRVSGDSGAVTLLDGPVALNAVDDDDGTGLDPREMPDAGVALLPPFAEEFPGIVPLQDAADEDLFGGKAASLARSLQAGLPVPPGLAFAHDAQIDEGLLLLLEKLPGRYAVRSSGIGEDGADASFAGQHETILGVEGAEGLLAALQKVAASAHADHVKQYRESMGEEEAQPRIGIVVQQLVPSRVAGVMFTRDPVGGTDNRIIEAAWGLGEVVVGSLVTPDHYVVARATSEQLEALPGEKSILMDHAGTHKVSADAAKALCLDAGALNQLNELADRCEAVFGSPQDIEWAFAGGELYLLQSRPITTE